MKLFFGTILTAFASVMLGTTVVSAVEDVLETCSFLDLTTCRSGTSCTFVSLTQMRCMPDQEFFSQGGFNSPNKKDHWRCAKFYRGGKMKAAIAGRSTEGWAAGSSLAAGVLQTNEIGVAYTLDGSVACYKQTCDGVSGSIGASFTATQITFSKRQMDCKGSGKVCKRDPTKTCSSDSDCIGPCEDCIEFKDPTHVFSTGVSFGVGLGGTAVYPGDITSANPIAMATTVSGGVSVSAVPGSYASCRTKVIHGGSLRYLISPTGKYLASVAANNQDVALRSNPGDAGRSEWLIIPYLPNSGTFLIYNIENDRFLKHTNPLKLEKISDFSEISGNQRHQWNFVEPETGSGSENEWDLVDPFTENFLVPDGGTEVALRDISEGGWTLVLPQED